MSQQKWYYINSSLEKVGPISSKALKLLADKGMITRQTPLMPEGSAHVYEAGNVKGLFPEEDLTLQSPSAIPTPPPISSAIPSSAPQPSAVTGQSIDEILAMPLPTAAPTTDPFANIPSTSVSVNSVNNDPFAGLPTAGVPASGGPGAPQDFPDLASSQESIWNQYPTAQAGGAGSKADQGDSSSTTTVMVLATVLVAAIIGLIVFIGVSRYRKPGAEAEIAVDGTGTAPAADGNASSGSTDAAAIPDRNRTGDDWRKMVDDFSFSSDEEFPPRPPKKGTEKTVSSTSFRNTAGNPEDGNSASKSTSTSDSTSSRPAIRSRPSGKELSTEEIVAATEGSVAVISGENSSGTAFVVLPGILATNSHVINSEEIEDLKVVFPSQDGTKNGPFEVKLLYENPERDLAFLEYGSQVHEPLSIVRDYKFRRGQKVIAIGSPGKGDGTVLQNAVCEGILSTQTEVDEQPYYQISIAVNSGNSGGPILTDAGEVLGVVTLKASKAEAVAYCIPPADVHTALEEVRQGNSVKIKEYRKMHTAAVPLHRAFSRFALLKEVPEHAEKKFTEDTIKEFDEALRRNPRCAEAYLGRGMLKAASDNFPGALKDLERAVQLAPDNEEYAKLRDSLQEALAQRQRMLAQGQAVTRFIVPTIPGMDSSPPPRRGFRGRVIGPNPSLASPRHVISPEQATRSQFRYQQIMEKEEWTFNGQKIEGKLIGINEDGIVQIQPKNATAGTKPIERYANRFSREDIDDFQFYAQYHGIQIGNLRKR